MEIVSIFSLLVAVVLSGILIIILYAVRKKRFFIRHFGVYSMTLLYLFCIVRMVLPLEFPFTTVIDLQPVLNPMIEGLYDQEIPIGNHSIRVLEFLIMLWGLAACILLIRFIIQYQLACRRISKLPKQEAVHMQQMMDRIQREQKHKIPVRVLYCPHVTVPCSFGFMKKQILLPSEEFTETELYYILLHEYTHFRNHDLAVKMLAYLFRCIFWWNPAAYLLTKDLQQVLEIKCDTIIISCLSDGEIADYLAAILMQLMNEDEKADMISISRAAVFFTGMKGKLAVEERFRYVQAYDGKRKRISLVRLAIFGMTFALLALSYLFVFQSAFEAPIEDIVTAKGVRAVPEEEITIRKNRDGIYTMMIENSKFEIEIDEEMAKGFIKQGTKFILE